MNKKTPIVMGLAAALGLSLVSLEASATLLLRSAFQNAALSIDGATANQTNSTINPLQSNTPTGAQVLAAYLYTSSVWGGAARNVSLNGEELDIASGTLLTPNANPANTYVFDVTDNVRTAINNAGGGLVTHTYSELSPAWNDGSVLAVVWRDATTQGTAIILDGELSTTGDTTTLNFDSAYAGGNFFMSLASSFSYNGDSSGANATGQVTRIDVTTDSTVNRRLTNAAGGNDDGNFVAQDGLLMTVGGIGDDPANPSLACSAGFCDDELYNLALGNDSDPTEFLQVGDTFIQFDTRNPSNDDNVFALFFTGDIKVSSVDDEEIPDDEDNNNDVPEPTGLALLAIGLMGLARARRRCSAAA